jgi:hypothetical protein
MSSLASCGGELMRNIVLIHFATGIATGRATMGRYEAGRSGVAKLENANETGQNATGSDGRG